MGLILRVIVYAIAGCLLFKKQMFLKSYYTLYSLYRLVVTPWRYKHNYTGKVMPWSAFEWPLTILSSAMLRLLINIAEAF